MAKYLVIVESPAKVKTIKKTSYLSKKLKGDKYYGISVRAKVGKKYGPWSPKRRVWVREK